MTALSTWSSQFEVFDGTTNVTTGHGVVYSLVSATGCTVAIDSSTGVITCSAITSDTASAVLQAVYNGVTIQKTESFAKARQGVAGSGFSPILLVLTSSGQTFSYDGTGTANPSGQSVTFTANRQNSSASVTWTVTDINGSARTPLSTYLTVATGSLSATMSEAQFVLARNGTSGVHVNVTMTDGSVFSDSISVVRVADGAAGTAGASGLNNALVYLYQRSASAPAVPSGTTTYTFASGVLSGTLGSWSQSVPAGSNPLYVTVATASSASTTDTIATGEWATPTIMAQDGATGATGAPGTNAATVFLYQRSASAPSVPSVTTTYSFTTGVLSSINNGWAQSVPTSNGNPCYITTATALSTTSTDTIGTGEWATPTILVQDGSTGAPGANNASVRLYQRAASTPSLPSVTTTYTFSTGVLTGQNNGWTQTVPTTNGNPLYTTLATASSNSATDTIAAAEWASAVIMVQDGATGGTGAAGLNQASVFLYQRAASAPAVPSVTTTYTFATNTLASINNGWQQTVPTTNGNPCYVTTASALSNTATDTIATGEWATPVILAQDGAGGATGPAGATISLTESAGTFYFVDGVAATPTDSITFTATRQNTSETVNFTTTPTVTLTGSGLTRALSITNFGTNTSVVVTATGATSGASASVTVVRSDASSGTDSIITDSDFGGSYRCVTTDTVLPTHDRAGNVRVGDQLAIGNPLTFTQRTGTVSFAEPEYAPCVRLRTKSGIELDCSTSAPIAIHDGSCVLARDLLGHSVPVIDGGVGRVEEVIAVNYLGMRQIMQITCEDDLFLAGRQQGRYLLHHNVKALWTSSGGRYDLL